MNGVLIIITPNHMKSPKLILTRISTQVLEKRVFSSMEDRKPPGHVILSLPEEERKILRELKSDDIKNDTLSALLEYKLQWIGTKPYMFGTSVKVQWKEMKQKFLDWLEKSR